jgi:DNA-binding PucR family transcriptional regulator
MIGPSSEALAKLHDDLAGMFKGASPGSVQVSKVAIEIACRKHLGSSMAPEGTQYAAQILFSELTKKLNAEQSLTDEGIRDVLQKVLGGDIQNRPLIEARAAKVTDPEEIANLSRAAIQSSSQAVEDEQGKIHGEIAPQEGGGLILALEDQWYFVSFENIWNGLMQSLDRPELTTQKNGHDS